MLPQTFRVVFFPPELKRVEEIGFMAKLLTHLKAGSVGLWLWVTTMALRFLILPLLTPIPALPNGPILYPRRITATINTPLPPLTHLYGNSCHGDLMIETREGSGNHRIGATRIDRHLTPIHRQFIEWQGKIKPPALKIYSAL